MYSLCMHRHYRHKNCRKCRHAPKVDASLGYMKTDALNSNMTLDKYTGSSIIREWQFGRNCACEVKNRKNRRNAASGGAKISMLCRKSGSLNPFPVRYKVAENGVARPKRPRLYSKASAVYVRLRAGLAEATVMVAVLS